jgi:hypothetical protein
MKSSPTGRNPSSPARQYIRRSRLLRAGPGHVYIDCATGQLEMRLAHLIQHSTEKELWALLDRYSSVAEHTAGSTPSSGAKR